MRSHTTAFLNRPQRIALFIVVLAYSYVGCHHLWRSSSTAAACSSHRRAVQSQLNKCLDRLSVIEARDTVEVSVEGGGSGDGRPNTTAAARIAGDLGPGTRKLLAQATLYLSAPLREETLLQGTNSVSLRGPSDFGSREDYLRMRTEEDKPDLKSEILFRVDQAPGEEVSLTESIIDDFGRRRLLAEAPVPLANYVDCSAATGFAKFMDYKPHQPCPDDWTLAQSLLLDERSVYMTHLSLLSGNGGGSCISRITLWNVCFTW